MADKNERKVIHGFKKANFLKNYKNRLAAGVSSTNPHGPRP